MMGRAIGLSMTFKSLLRLTTNVTHRAQIEAEIGQLISDRYIVEGVLLRNNIPYLIPPEAMFLQTATPVQNVLGTTPVIVQTQSRAQSTMRPPTGYPTKNYFDYEFNNMTFDTSHPYTAVDNRARANGNAVPSSQLHNRPPKQQNHVTFGTKSRIITKHDESRSNYGAITSE